MKSEEPKSAPWLTVLQQVREERGEKKGPQKAYTPNSLVKTETKNMHQKIYSVETTKINNVQIWKNKEERKWTCVVYKMAPLSLKDRGSGVWANHTASVRVEPNPARLPLDRTLRSRCAECWLCVSCRLEGQRGARRLRFLRARGQDDGSGQSVHTQRWDVDLIAPVRGEL